MFNQKETELLQDLKSSEQLCVEKYTKYENNASAAQLKEVMSSLKVQEQTHLDTICKIINGEVPSVEQGGQKSTVTPQRADYSSNSNGYDNDKFLCSDALSTEKHVSSVYDTSIFEFKNVGVRNVLNHIQKEEQEHGEKLYNYMEINNMYS